MGTWGVGTFENDAASDWVYDLEKVNDVTILKSTIAAITESDAYLEARACENALAAAEVIAALGGQPAADLPESVTTWIKLNAGLRADELRSPSAAAIDRTLADSELKQLWDETDDAESWAACVRDLRARLNS